MRIDRAPAREARSADSRRDVTTWATFPGHGAAAAYLATFDPALAGALPHFEGPRRYDGFTTVFTAR